MPPIAYMIDQSNNLKDPIEDLLQATDAIQHTLAVAACVDRSSLAVAQEADDPALSAEILQAAYRADVRPLVAEARRRNGAALDPVTAYRRSGYRDAVTKARGSGHVATGL
jgi:L-rhamnose isomerase/sugar isomerase